LRIKYSGYSYKLLISENLVGFWFGKNVVAHSVWSIWLLNKFYVVIVIGALCITKVQTSNKNNS